MTTRFWCARCGRSYEVPGDLIGRRVRCRACGHVQLIPEPARPARAPVAAEGPSTYALASTPPPQPTSAPASPAPPPSHGARRPRRDRSEPWRKHLRDLASEAGHLQGLSLVLLTLSITD